MYSFIPAALFLGVGIWLYRREFKKEPEFRNKANFMLASYAMILALLLLALSIMNWGKL
jgi:hypothetical protein